jgi:ABC-type amino acid transport substrate-binding protein
VVNISGEDVKMKRRSLVLALAIMVLMAFAFSACTQGSTGVKNSEIQKPEDLAGKKVGVQVGTTADESCQKYLETIKFEVTKYDQIIQTFTELKTGRLDAIIVDEVVARDYATKYPQDYKITGARLTNEPIGICFKKENAAMRDAVDDLLVDMRADGALKAISEKWFGEDLTTDVDGAATEKVGTGSFPADKKVLKVGVDDVYPPMEYKDDKNTTVGFDVDLAKEIGKRLGMEVEFVSTAWDGIFTSLNTDKFDCIISSVSINEDRQQNFALTKPYIANAQVIVVQPDK